MAKLILIHGTGRSGSTMLDLMLGNSPDGFSCGEISAWFRPYRRHHFRIDCPCEQNPCPVWSRIASVKEDGFHAHVIQELGVSFVVDSSKDLCWLIDAQAWAEENNIETVNVLIWKSPIDLAYSYWKRGQNAAHWRKSFISSYKRVIEFGLPALAVNYSALVLKPKEILENTCRAIGIPYFDGKERFWENDSHHLFGSKAVRDQLKRAYSTIRAGRHFPSQFESIEDDLLDQLATDTSLLKIVAHLEQIDVANVDRDSVQQLTSLNRSSLPFWYYRKRVVRKIRQFVPESYDPDSY